MTLLCLSRYSSRYLGWEQIHFYFGVIVRRNLCGSAQFMDRAAQSMDPIGVNRSAFLLISRIFARTSCISGFISK